MQPALVLAWCSLWCFSQSLPDSDPRAAAKMAFERGKQFFTEKRFAEAADQFEQTLKFTPDSPLLHNLLGLCQLQLGQVALAIAEFQKCTALKPDYKAAHNNLGGIYLLQGRHQDAIGEFEAVIKLDPGDIQALTSLARAEVAVNRKESATEHLVAAYRLAPASLPVALALARLYLDTAKKDVGRPLAQSLIDARADDAPSHFQLGLLLLDYGFEDAAQNHLRNALKLNPKLQQSLYLVGLEHFKRQDYKLALKCLECLEPPPSKAGNWHAMVGYSRFKLGDSKEAANELQKAIEAEPHNQDYVLELAEVFVANNNTTEAVVLMERATKVFPSSPQVWFGLGVAYLGDEKRALAEPALKRALELEPTLELAYVVLGQCYKEAADWGHLLSVSEQLMRVNPRNSASYYFKALALQSSKDTEDAQIEYLLAKSLELNHSEPEPHYELAKLLARQGKRDESVQALETIVQSWPEFGPAYYQLARLYRERGELEKSKTAQATHDRIRQKERSAVMKRMIVEIQQRPNTGGAKTQ